MLFFNVLVLNFTTIFYILYLHNLTLSVKHSIIILLFHIKKGVFIVKTIITDKDLKAVNTMLYELLCLHRWSEVTVTNGNFTEQSKQNLNCMISYVWAKEIEHAGYYVDFTKFPKLAFLRGFTKIQQCDISEQNLSKIFTLGGVSKDCFSNMVVQEIRKETSPEFLQHIMVDPDCLESYIYKAATKVSTLLELRDIRRLIDGTDYQLKEAQLQEVLNVFSDLPCFDIIMSDSYQEIFRNFSKLRNRIRWAKHPNIIPCSVLGHMFDVACFAYLMSLEVNDGDEELATKYFFMGVFHDLPECWTGDMPSPIKDSIPGLRKATEEFENMVMEENIYSHLPNYMVTAIRTIMLEDDKNIHHKAFLKKSDNFSAFIECWRELDAGSHHYYYKNVIKRDYHNKENLPHNFRLLLECLYENC